MPLVKDRDHSPDINQIAPSPQKAKRGELLRLLLRSLWLCLQSAPWIPAKWRYRRDLDPSEVDLQELTSESNLFEVFISSLQITPSSYTLPITLWVAGLLCLYSLFDAPKTVLWAKLVRDWADNGIGFTTTILGFLIAGFTIFASVGPSRMFRHIALERHKPSGLPYLKYAFFALMRVFATYLIFAAFCFSIKIFFFPNGPLSTFFYLLPDSIEHHVMRFWVGLCFIGLGSGFFYTLISLSSFIYNVCYFVLHIIRWEIENPE